MPEPLKDELSITYSTPDDRRSVVAELYIGDEQFAEVNDDRGEMSIEFYPLLSGAATRVNVDDLVKIIALAIQGLGFPLGQRGKFKRLPDSDDAIL